MCIYIYIYIYVLHTTKVGERFKWVMLERYNRNFPNLSLHPKYPACVSFVFFWNVAGCFCSDSFSNMLI